jgi:UDP-N-acetylglucosamine 3-dehydrogenase
MKIGVIGTGTMGQNHVRILRSFPDIEVSISDINIENLELTGNRFGITRRHTNYLKLLEIEKPDAVIIATQPHTHKEIAIASFENGVHVLLEKPIALDATEAEEIISFAEKTNLIFTVGHVERFNPVISKIKDFLTQGMLNNIYLINTRRVGPFPKRLIGKAEGVMIDLAVHDFDIISFLGGKFDNIEASQIIKSNCQEVYVKSLINLENGIKATSEFSWISPKRIRSIEIYADEGMLFGDYFDQEVWVYENDDFDNLSKNRQPFFQNGQIKSGKIVKYPMYKQEPLLLELTNFINSIKGAEQILVKPKEALVSLKYALSIFE